MPRVKVIRAEVGTTGTIVSLPITGDAARDIGSAVEHEHSCEDSHCDIAAALRGGFPFSAGFLLAGATETPLLDAVANLYSFNLSRYPSDFEDWSDFHNENGRECDSCGSFTYQDEGTEDVCGNCLAAFKPLPSEEDAFIGETRDGYVVSVEQTYLGTFEDSDGAREFLASWMEEHEYFPNAWEVNERGNTELLVRDPENLSTFKHEGTGYV